MSQLSPEQSIGEPGIAVRAPAAARPVLISVAWIATLLLSKLPLLIARDLIGGDITWIAPAWWATAGLLIVATFVSSKTGFSCCS